MGMKNIFIFLLISGLFSSCIENNPQQKTGTTDLTNTDTNASEKITKEEKKAWLKISKVSLYEEDTITWSDEKAVIFNKEGYKVLFEDKDLTYYESDVKEYSLEEIKSFESSEPERYEKMMNELSKRSNNYTLLAVSGPYVSYKDEWYYDGGARPNGGIDLECYSLITDSIVQTINVSTKADNGFKSQYEQAITKLNNFIVDKTYNKERMHEEMKKLSGTYTDNGDQHAYFYEMLSCKEYCGSSLKQCKTHISKERSFSINGAGPDGFITYIVTYDPVINKLFTHTPKIGFDNENNDTWDTTKFYIAKEKVLDNNYITFRNINKELKHVLKEGGNEMGEKIIAKHGLSGEYISVETNKTVVFDNEEFKIKGWDLGSDYSFGYSIYDVRESVIKTDKAKLYFEFGDNRSISFYEAIEGDEWSKGTFLDSLIPTKNEFIKNDDCIYCFSNSELLLKSELDHYTELELHIMMNELLARNGYMFNKNIWYKYFSLYKWYKPISGLGNSQAINPLDYYPDNSCLKTEIEQYNFKQIKNYLFSKYSGWKEAYWIMVMDEDFINLIKGLKKKND